MSKHTPGPWHREGNCIVAGSVRVAVVDTPQPALASSLGLTQAIAGEPERGGAFLR